jgi:HK97 family phage major capsid protein/HK97 family phage prohead protease
MSEETNQHQASADASAASGSPDQGSRAASVRLDSSAKFTREASFAPEGLDAKARTCELSFSSEMPVERGGYMEVLSHAPGDVDLQRLNDSHPLLLNHDPERQIGVVHTAAVGADKRGRAVVRFSKSPLGEEIWKDVQDGIRRLVSVGYRRMKELSSEVRDGVESVRFAWQPYEISIVSVPADASVGVGRAEQTSVSKKEKTIMSENIQVAATRDIQKENGEIIAISKNLANKVEGIRDLADKAISEGWTVDAFRAQALNKLPEARPVSQSPLADVKARDWKNYSISRAVSMQMGDKREGFESEMDQELALKNGKRAGGMWIPDEVFSRNLIAGTPTLGGFLVQNTVASGEFIELLRNKSQVLNLGARVLNLTGPTFLPRHNGAGTANWVGESVASTLTGVNLTNMTLTPQAISAYHQYSKMLLMEANPSIDGIVRDDIIQTLAIAIDLAALHGSGSGQPTGIAQTVGINTVALKADGQLLGNTTAFPALVSLESEVAADNADSGSLAYLMRPAHRGALRVASRFASTDTPVWDPATNRVNGYRAEVTNQIATNLTTGTATTICSAVFFGNWNELLIANFGSTDLVVDPYTAGANGVVRLYARRWVDIGVRHPQSFAMLGGIL